jgi:multicomponent Na+:H+ antiporter subunit E
MTDAGRGQLLVSWVARGLGYFALWMVLIGFDPTDLLVGLVAAGAATWASVYLLPPGEFRLRLAGLPRYGLRFLWQSVVAGVDVARQAFAPRQSLRPGLVSYCPHYPRGARRNAFASLTSLLPGTLVLCDEPERLTYHCLDDRQPLVEQLAAEEDALSRVLPRECVS